MILGFAGGIFAQPRPQLCLPDADGDGHPLFGNPQIRPGFEVNASGQVAVSDATTVAFGDLDGDGDLDAAVTNIRWHFLNNGVYSVTVLMNRGDGVFDPPVEYQAGREPAHVIIADFNGDGFPDLAVANASGSTVSVLLNNGDGTFSKDVEYPCGSRPRSLVSDDFDGDGDMDIAALDAVADSVQILLNTGGGVFAPAVRVPVGNVTPRGIGNMTFPVPGPFLACGDLSGDGVPDLAVPALRRIKVLIGDGAGGFTLSSSHPSVVGGSAYAVRIGDLDGDGDLDIAAVIVFGYGDDGLNVILNRGGAVFDPPVGYNVATQPSSGALYFVYSLSLGDLEGDGDLDVAVGYLWRQVVSVFRNNGDGSLAAKETYPVHPGPWFVEWADVNGDGATDLAVLATGVRSKLAILLNDGDGGLITQEETPPYFSGSMPFPWISPTSVASADLDGDGDQDLAVSIGAHEDPSTVTIMFNDGDGAFDQIVPHLLGPVGESWAEHVVVADFNGDGVLDLAVADGISPARRTDDGKVWVLLGLGGGAFAPAVPYQLDGLYPMHVATGDLDGDGDTDLALWTSQFHPGNNTTPVDRRVVIMLNDGTGLFQFAGEHTIGTAEWLLSFGAVEAGDLDADGDLDLVATMSPRRVDGSLTVLLNTGGGVFVAQQAISLAPQPYSLALTDVDDDGDLDIAVLHNHNHSLEIVLNDPYLTVLYNDGGAGFSARDEYIDPSTITFGKIAAEDLDGDGDIDLTLPEAFSAVLVHLNQGQGAFARGVHYGVGDLPAAVAAADFDGDGRIDIVTSNLLDQNITLLRNLGCPRCYADCDQSTGRGVLDLRDFLCFQTAFMKADPYACDCDTSTGQGVCDIFDFLCFQNAFVAGCP
ncbi:MAG: VCBS repeat-containing protein [Planctomycetes bacterium]|nr:VCBS repeat-containing protein [Planctomycetota bacterium]